MGKVPEIRLVEDNLKVILNNLAGKIDKLSFMQIIVDTKKICPHLKILFMFSKSVQITIDRNGRGD